LGETSPLAGPGPEGDVLWGVAVKETDAAELGAALSPASSVGVYERVAAAVRLATPSNPRVSAAASQHRDDRLGRAVAGSGGGVGASGKAGAEFA
jgi:hypothetical protein